jgi:hypothetical protein
MERKKQALAASNLLSETSILKQVFSFLPGHWLFLGAACREWEAVYADMGEQHICSFCLLMYNKPVPCGSKMTLYSAAVASPATATLGSSCGLIAKGGKHNLQLAAGLLASTETLAALCELGMPLSDAVVNMAALSGRLNILQQLLSEQQCPRPSTISHYAAGSGNITMLKWLKTEGWCEFNHDTCAAAAAAGQLAALQHLRSEGCVWKVEDTACYAANSGSVEVAEWLRQTQGMVVDAKTLAWAASAGQIAMCKHLRSVGCEWDSSACIQAVMSGEITMLRWLRENGCPWVVRDVCCAASRYGYSDPLDYIIEQGEVLDAELLTVALNCAGASNQLRAAQWLRQHGAEWPAVLTLDEHDEESNKVVDVQWHADMIVWARAEGCTARIAL